MVGSAVATIVWSSAARNIVSIRLIRMVRTSLWVSARANRGDGPSLNSITSVGICDSSCATASDNVECPADRSCRSYLFMAAYDFLRRATGARKSFSGFLFRWQIRIAAAGSAHGWSPRAKSVGWVRWFSSVFSGLWPFFEPRPLRQLGGPLHDMILEVGVGDLVLGTLDAAADGNAGLMHGIGIARNQRVPPIKVAALRPERGLATRRQPVQGTDVFRRQPHTIRYQIGPVRVVLTGT